MRWIRLGLLALLFGLPFWWSLPSISRIQDSYQKPCVTPLNPTVGKAASGIQSGQSGVEPSLAKPVPDSLAQQNKQMIDWGVLLLGGIIALITTTKVHPIKHYEWWFLILGPASSSLLGSLWAGVVFQRRAAYLALQPCPESIDSLIQLLTIQNKQLERAGLILSAFALIFLIGIVFGSVKPHEGP